MVRPSRGAAPADHEHSRRHVARVPAKLLRTWSLHCRHGLVFVLPGLVRRLVRGGDQRADVPNVVLWARLVRFRSLHVYLRRVLARGALRHPVGLSKQLLGLWPLRGRLALQMRLGPLWCGLLAAALALSRMAHRVRRPRSRRVPRRRVRLPTRMEGCRLRDLNCVAAVPAGKLLGPRRLRPRVRSMRV
jgi:hypothetical protein